MVSVFLPAELAWSRWSGRLVEHGWLGVEVSGWLGPSRPATATSRPAAGDRARAGHGRAPWRRAARPAYGGLAAGDVITAVDGDTGPLDRPTSGPGMYADAPGTPVDLGYPAAAPGCLQHLGGPGLGGSGAPVLSASP